MSAIVSKKQLDRVVSYLELAREEKATIALGGSAAPIAGLENGFFVEPTILTDVKHSSRVNQEEIFGPVLSVTTFTTAKEAVEMANDTEYGLAAAVWTSNITKGHKVAAAIRAGTVWVNSFDTADIIVPFGGFKSSGFGRDRSLHALDSYTALKTTWIHLGGEPI